MNDLKVGDLVRVQGSDVKMSVNTVYAFEVICQWFVGTTLNKDTFHRSSLIKINKT